MSRHPARKGPADSNQPAIKEAIELLIHPLRVMVLSAAGNGVEDLLVPLVRLSDFRIPIRWWLLVECKVEHPSYGKKNPVRYTTAQVEWRAQTAGWPRITATSAQNAVDQIRELTDPGGHLRDMPDACRVCGCTEDDCSQCVEKTGEPCSWVAPRLCSACVDDVREFARDGFGVGALAHAAPLAQATPGGNVASVTERRTMKSTKTTKAKPKRATSTKAKGRSTKGATKRKVKSKPRKSAAAET